MHVCMYANDVLISHTKWVCDMLYEMEHEAFENKCGVGKVFNKYITR
jgi:hypothetical protein